jgi:salicylate hydroxylase
MKDSKHVVIVGCGVAGLALALALKKAGIRYTVLERAPELGFVGAGIQLSPNATRVLSRLNVLERIAPRLVRPGHHRFVDWQSASPLLTTPLGDVVASTFGSLYGHAHRADLLHGFVDALGPDANIRLGVEVEQVGNENGKAFALCTDGTRVVGDVVVAADGVRSAIREAQFAPSSPSHSGCMAWRGLTPAADVRDLGFKRDSYIWLGPNRSVVIYYVSGGEFLNWIGMTPSDGVTRESWTVQGTVDEALAEFAGWHSMVRTLIGRSAPPYKWALYDREPLPTWIKNRIALIGDAAHAMLPYHAQGAAQSIEDAWVLARCLQLQGDNVDGALSRYNELRGGRTRQVQEASRAAERMFHLSEPEAVERRNARFTKLQAAIGHGFPPGQEWLFAYDAEHAAVGSDDNWQTLDWAG